MTYEAERAESPERVERPKHPGSPELGESHGRNTARQLIPQDERDKLTLRLQQSLGGFVDGPRHAVQEAAAVLDDTADRITATLAERRQSLRAGWHGEGDGDAAETEELRVALRAYREVTERLLRL